MLLRRSWLLRLFALVSSISTASMVLVPAANAQSLRLHQTAVTEAKLRAGMKPNQTQALTPEQLAYVQSHLQNDSKPAMRRLTKTEMSGIRGRGVYRSRYFGGTLPWQRSFRDINLSNGNLFKSFTDMQVSPAKGAGLAMQRTYNANDERFGPFGQGWTHAYDIRIEEAPNANVSDTNLNYTERSDFFGAKHRYHRDADGLYSPPPYLFDELDSNYNTFLVNGPADVMDDTQRSMDGTVKHFTKVNGSSVRVCDYIQDRYGNTTTLTYTTVTVGSTVTPLVATVTDPSGRVLTFTWSNVGTVANPLYRITLVDGPVYDVAYAYNEVVGGVNTGNVTGVTLDSGSGNLNRTTTYAYGGVSGANGTETGLLTSISDPLGSTLTYGYSISTAYFSGGSVFVSRVTEAGGVNAQNQSRNQQWNLSASYQISNWASPGWFVKAAHSTLSNLEVSCVVDTSLRSKGLMLYYGGVAQQTLHTKSYDSANNVLTSQNQLWSPTNGAQDVGRQDVFTYGPHGNQLTHQIAGYSGTDTTEYYDASQYFQKKSVTDMAGRVTRFGVGSKYDTTVGNRGSVLWVKDAKYGDGTFNNTGTRFSYTYNTYGQKVSETNNNNILTTYTYGDNWGNLTQVVQDAGSGKLNRTTTMTYDIGSRVTSSTDPMGRQSTFSYNNLGQPTSASFPAANGYAAETVSYTYGGNGRMNTVSDAHGNVSLSYESNCDRVSSVTDSVTGTMSYTYGLSGERLTASLPGGGTWTYTYGGLGTVGPLLPKDDPNSLSQKLVSIADDNGRIVEYTLDRVGMLRQSRTNETYTTGMNPALIAYLQTDYTYDTTTNQWSHGWLTQVKTRYYWKDANNIWQNSLVSQNDYTSYDAVGNRLNNNRSGTMGAYNETYSYDELYRLTNVTYGDNSQTQSYAFDSMGNRSQKQDSVSGTENYTYNAANMILTRGSNNYTNDSNGNTLTGGGRTNTWDSQNRLRQVVYGSNTSTFTYASDGLRRQATFNGTTTDYILDSSMMVRERQGGVNKATYFVGARGPEYRRDDSTGVVRWYVFDGLGSVVGEVDASENVTSSRKLDVYGAVRGGTNSGGTSKHKFVGSLGHTSDDETGLVYMRARHYDPTTGRFASEDPKGDGINWFAYCRNNPIKLRDASGKTTGSTEDEEAAIIASDALDAAGGNIAMVVKDFVLRHVQLLENRLSAFSVLLARPDLAEDILAYLETNGIQLARVEKIIEILESQGGL